MTPISYRIGEAWWIERYDPILAELEGHADEEIFYLSGAEANLIENRILAAEAVKEYRGERR